MTLSELYASLIALLTRVGSNRVTAPEVLQACQNVVAFFATQISAIMPDWTAGLTFNTDGTGAGKYCKIADTTGRKRLFETKTSGNINHTPPTDPAITENTYWKEISASAGAAIPEWAVGLFGPGIIIVFHNHSVDGPGLYYLTDPARPYSSTNIETEITAGKWVRLGGTDGGGTITSVNGDVGPAVSLSASDVGADAAGAAAAALATAKAYADGLVVGLWDDRGTFSAAGGAYPTSSSGLGGSGPAGAIRKQDVWTASAGGTLPTGQLVKVGDTVRAMVDSATNIQPDWAILPMGVGYVPENVANKNASGGYAGLSLFKIMMRNAANTFTSFLTNVNTAVRTYTFQNRDGVIADDTDIAAANTYADAGDAFVQNYAEGLNTTVPAKATMDVARTTALPSYVATPGSGSTRTILTASVNGAFPTTDSIAVASISSVLVTGETSGNAKYNGPYVLLDPGSAGSKWILQRTKDTQAAFMTFPVELAEVRIKRGTVNAGRTFRQTTLDVTVDTTAQTWVATDEPVDSTGTVIRFDQPRFYGIVTSAETGNFTLDTTGFKRGVTQVVRHNNASTPSFSSEYKLKQGSYSNGVDNYIYLTSISSTEIQMSIVQ